MRSLHVHIRLDLSIAEQLFWGRESWLLHVVSSVADAGNLTVFHERATEGGGSGGDGGQKRTHRPSPTGDWIQPQHDQLLDLLERSHGKLLGADREFVLEGVRNGCYSYEQENLELTHNSFKHFSADATVCVGVGYQIHIAGKMIHHGSLWTTKSTGERHREHLGNCVKHSQAWREIGDRRADISIPDVVENLAQRFGEWEAGPKMYLRLHKGDGGSDSVKVFVGGARYCSRCDNCDAYEYLNALLACDAPHGPKMGWAADKMRSRMQRRRRHRDRRDIE
eukprot:TRINITY_DN93432_c0_g1_i1.p1 TRINITY_DN93432_c0_g1~~TRINITY_DN93432_c0_g1_i1.p1  ORF type:complete len:280 (+),score=19.41 TRINITY_DN93432_c0_g1_i1:10-849(+)